MNRPTNLSAQCRRCVRTFFLLWVISTACATLPGVAHDNTGAVDPDGRFTPNEAGVTWPPQPRGITNIQQHPASSSVVLDPLTPSLQEIEADSKVASALGHNYAYLGMNKHEPKWASGSVWYELTFYSYSLNQTIQVTVRSERIESVDTTPADVDQPALSQGEMKKAIDLARAYWLAKGINDIADLKAYAIQTFQPDGSPFSTRMAYVSFHIESPQPPLFAADVDLSSGEVVQTRVEN